MQYRTVVVDDFMMARQVFENAIKESGDFVLAASFSETESAVKHIERFGADLVIMDVVMTEGPSGLSAAEKIKKIAPSCKILIVTSMPEVSYINRARAIGAESFWYKAVQSQTILEVMRRTMAGESIYPDSSPVIRLGNAVSSELSAKEIAVLRKIVDGLSNKEIADSLGVSERTVKMHIAHMLEKTGFRSRLELAVKVSTGGLIIPE